MALKADSIIFGCGIFSSTDLQTRSIFVELKFRRNLERLGKWDCCCAVLRQERAIIPAPVDDENQLKPSISSENHSVGIQQNHHTGFHRDLNSLPSEFSSL